MISIKNSGIIILTILFALTALTTSYECPDYCTCTVTHGSHIQNHAKCDSIDGLKIEGKQLQLHSLDLSKLNLTRLDIHLEKFKDLVCIDLSHNRLSEVGKFGRRIKTLNLSYNTITSGKLSKIPSHVENLDLSYNEITYLPMDLSKLSNLRSIELSGNTINCTCETLEVRNWLQKNHVWTDNHIKCSYPADVKGQPWLRVRQSDICEYHDTKPRSIPLRLEAIDAGENDLMLGDQPVINEGSAEKESMEELSKDFLPVDGKNENSKKSEELMYSDDPNIDNGEGSGDDVFEKITEPAIVDHIDRIDTSVDNGETHSPLVEHQNDSLAFPLDYDHEEFESHDEIYKDEHIALVEHDDQEDEGSGSGMGMALIPRMLDISNNTRFVFEASEKDPDDDEILDEVTDSDVISRSGLGIFKFSEKDSNVTDELPMEVVEEEIIPVKIDESLRGVQVAQGGVDTDVVTASGIENGEDTSNKIISEKIKNGTEINQAGTGGNNKGTYILLTIILIGLIALILFVVIKRRRANRRNQNLTDAENPRSTELMDMDKTNLGKPINKNGNAEHAPLINNHDNKTNFAKPANGDRQTPYKPTDDKDNKLQEPLLKKLDNRDEPDSIGNDKKPELPKESNNNVTTPVDVTKSPNNEQLPVAAPRQNAPVTPESVQRAGQYPPTKSKSPLSQRSPISPAVPPPPTTDDDEVFLPSSPKTSRYSPVYSPETGRVKIKLTETPKPKTPLLVTRSKSNAGDIITTPNLNQRADNTVDQ